MGRERDDPKIVIQSSIALLQERFRQLDRVKEMREQRELQKMVMQYDYYEQSSRLFFHFLPKRTSSPQVPLSLWPDSQSKQLLHDDDEFNQWMETSQFMSLQQRSETVPTSSMHTYAKKFETCNYHDDVDTSLHL